MTVLVSSSFLISNILHFSGYEKSGMHCSHSLHLI